MPTKSKDVDTEFEPSERSNNVQKNKISNDKKTPFKAKTKRESSISSFVQFIKLNKKLKYSENGNKSIRVNNMLFDKFSTISNFLFKEKTTPLSFLLESKLKLLCKHLNSKQKAKLSNQARKLLC